MHIELICIGDELLEGQTINSNATTLAKVLKIKFARITTVADSSDEIVAAVEEALSRSDFVITSGGLGPTVDDLTKDVLAGHFGDFKELPNQVGSAPGLLFLQGKKHLAALPGVPLELEEMAKASLTPLVTKEEVSIEEIHFAWMNEREIDPDVRLWCKQYPKLQFGIYPHSSWITLRIRGEGAELCADKVRARYQGRFFSEENLYAAIHQEMIKRDKTLATAESCSGGTIASYLTRIPGASDYFQGGIVCYSNTFKEKYLSVAPETLATHGAVSRETVIEMAQGALQHADYSIAVSGIAGPDGGTEEKPVGYVWAAIGDASGKVLSGLVPMGHKRTRAAIIERTSSFTVGALWLYITGGKDVLSN